MKKYIFSLLGLMGLLSSSVFAAIHEQTILYKHGETVLEGHLVYDDQIELEGKKTPAVIVVHEWKGLNDYAKERARMLAELGYVAFAVDMYGKDVRPTTHKEAAQVSGIYRNDRLLMRSRIDAGLKVLQHHPLVDTTKIAAIGYCFGGTTVLELARSGAPVVGVACFHGGLNTPHSEDAQNILGKVYVFHGGNDTFVTPDEVTAFENEMKKAQVDYKLKVYPGAVHGFTVKANGSDPNSGMAYDEQADSDSWKELLQFIGGLFAKV